jgi:hypothetical protein
MAKKEVYLGIILIVGIVVLVYISNHGRGGVSPINYFASIGENNSFESSNVILLTENQLENSQGIDLTKGEIVKFSFINNSYYFTITEINLLQKRIGFLLGDNKIYLDLYSSKKIDLNRDGYYDILVGVDSLNSLSAKVNFKKINEKSSIGDSVDTQINNALENAEQNYALEFNLIIIILAILLFLLALYLIKKYAIPMIRLRNASARQKPADALNYLIDEFERANLKGDKESSKKLKIRILHLYGHLSEKDRKNYRNMVRKIKDM